MALRVSSVRAFQLCQTPARINEFTHNPQSQRLNTGTELTCDDANCGENAYCDEGDEGDGYTCRCDTGTTGSDVANGAATCVENTCEAFVFTGGVIGDTSNNDACSNNIVLTAVSDNSCDLACNEGYKSSGM